MIEPMQEITLRVMLQVVKHMGAVFSRNLLKHLGEA